MGIGLIYDNFLMFVPNEGDIWQFMSNLTCKSLKMLILQKLNVIENNLTIRQFHYMIFYYIIGYKKF